MLCLSGSGNLQLKGPKLLVLGPQKAKQRPGAAGAHCSWTPARPTAASSGLSSSSMWPGAGRGATEAAWQPGQEAAASWLSKGSLEPSCGAASSCSGWDGKDAGDACCPPALLCSVHMLGWAGGRRGKGVAHTAKNKNDVSVHGKFGAATRLS